MSIPMSKKTPPKPILLKPLTPKIVGIFDFICDFIRKKRYSPSLMEIATGCSLSMSTVNRAVSILEDRGHIARIPQYARGITILSPIN